MSAPDGLQADALIKLFKLYGWSHMSIIMSRTDYGRHAMDISISLALEMFDTRVNASELDVGAQLNNIRRTGE